MSHPEVEAPKVEETQKEEEVKYVYRSYYNGSEYVTKEDFDKKFDEIMAAIAGLNRSHYNNNRKGDRNDTRND